MRSKLVLWFLLLLAGFLVGFILQYSRLQRVQQELSASTKQLGSCQSSQQLAQLRDTATMMYLEVVQKNYGKAGEYSREVFDQAQEIANSTEDSALRNLLRDTLATRDQVTADLAKGDAAALSETQLVLAKLEQTAKH
ncbi:MAG: hypothetical protein WA628_01620 [Terriglobales bacterium]